MLGNPNGIAATTDEVGQAMSYKAGLSFAVEPPAGAPAGAPDWVQALYVYLDNRFNATQNNIAQLCDEQLVLLANSQAGNGLPLYDPTLPGQWALLAAPNPTTRDDLMAFDREWQWFYNYYLFTCRHSDIQCMTSAAALGLPPLPVDVDLPTRKRQIAAKIGVAMCWLFGSRLHCP